MPKEFQKYVVSQKAMIMRGDKCLIVRLLEEPGHPASLKWDTPGGRIDEGEDAEFAFRRELQEETGLTDVKIVGLADHIITYPDNPMFSPYCGFIYLVEIEDQTEIKLSFEHCEMKWITKEGVDDYVYCWEKMPQMIKRGFEIYQKIK